MAMYGYKMYESENRWKMIKRDDEGQVVLA